MVDGVYVLYNKEHLLYTIMDSIKKIRMHILFQMTKISSTWTRSYEYTLERISKNC